MYYYVRIPPILRGFSDVGMAAKDYTCLVALKKYMRRKLPRDAFEEMSTIGAQLKTHCCHIRVQYKEERIRMIMRPQVGIGILITKDDRVLLLKQSNEDGGGTWSTPVGRLAYGELLEACAIRESQKEIGVIIADVTFLAITNDVFEAQKEHDITIWMAGRYVSGTPTMNAVHGMSTIDWFSWDTLPEPLFLPFERLLTGQCYPALWDFSGGEKP